jgi:hypothetical protein
MCRELVPRLQLRRVRSTNIFQNRIPYSLLLAILFGESTPLEDILCS